MSEMIIPDWPAPANVRAGTTTRHGGVSIGAFTSLNLAAHVGDRTEDVLTNRKILQAAWRLPAEPLWLMQKHGTRVVLAEEAAVETEADASCASSPGRVCAVLTADCLPVLVCDDTGTRVAAVHAGWRGLLDGVLEATVRAQGCDPARLLAWLGPAIGPESYEVGVEIRERFVAIDPGAAAGFRPTGRGRWWADLYVLARQRLAIVGVHRIYGGQFCTLREPGRFFSYRRDGVCGRMASVIWLDP